MEQACYKCGQVVDEGMPFCPHCSAPQIRVIISEAIGQTALAGAAVLPSADSGQPQVVLPQGWSATFRPCVLAAFIAALLPLLGLYAAVAMLAAGFLAALFYRQRWPGAPIRLRMGARLGALSGFLWFVICSIAGVAATLYLHKGDEIRAELVKMVNQATAQTTDPQVVAWFEYFRTAAGLETLMIILLVFSLIVSVLLGIVGGVLGGSLFGRVRKN